MLLRMRQRFGNRRGSAMVEFALVAPILVLLLVGIMVMGLVINAKLVVAGAAREAGRAYAVTRGSSTDKERAARIKANDAVSGGGLKPSRDGVTLFEPGNDVHFRREGDYVRVSVTYRQPAFAPLIANLIDPSGGGAYVTLSSEAVFRIEKGR